MAAASSAPLGGVRVVHVSTVHRSDDTRIRIKQCRSIAAAGAETHLVARAGRTADAVQGVDSITVHELREPTMRLDRFARLGVEAARVVRRLDADIVHFHDPELLPYASVFRGGGARVIYDVHEDLPRLVKARSWIPRALRSAVSSVAGWAEPGLARACHGFVFVDERWNGRFPDRAWVTCRNAPLAAEFAAQPDRRQPDPPHFVYIGAVSETRGATRAVEALALLDEPAVLTLAGPVESERLADDLRASAGVHDLRLPGPIDRATVLELLGSATAGLALLEPTPAYDDATATKIFEYMGAGLPIILSSTAAHRRIAHKHACALLADHDDPAAVAAHMRTLVTDVAVRDRLAEAARRAFDVAPKWEDEAAGVIDLYQRLLS